MKLIGFTMDNLVEILRELVGSGITVVYASQLIGLSKSQGFYHLGVPKEELRHHKKRCVKYMSYKRLKTAERLIRKGVLINVVVAATGLTAQQIIDYFDNYED